MYKYAIAVVVLLAMILPVHAVVIVVAQGDPFAYRMDQQTEKGTCWYFSNGNLKFAPSYFDIPSTTGSPNNTICSLSRDQTSALSPGDYTLVYEIPAEINGRYIKDISYSNRSLVSAMTGTRSIDTVGMPQTDILTNLKQMITTDNINTYEENIVRVEVPDLKIRSTSATANNIFTFSGTTNLADGTDVQVIIDQDMPNTGFINKSFEFHTTVNRTTPDSGIWSAEVPLPVENMAPGWHDCDVYARGIHANVKFPLYRGYSDQTPHNTTINYLGDGNIAPVTITIPVTVIQTQYVDRWHNETVTPTPVITDALGYKVDYQTDPKANEAKTIFYGIVALSGAMICIAIILFRRKT